ncbi:phosphoheptose isomerase family protein [Vibrio jasicida]|uniref:VCBS repeat-containing protein n=1 Tax=Vibrio jasicida TaxID=766224 RepID=A0ABW7J3U6_9VIBR
MKELLLLSTLLFGANVLAQEKIDLDSSYREILPNGHTIIEAIHGDLNRDSRDDIVLMIQGTDQNKIVTDELRGRLDLNRRGIIVALRGNDKYDVVVENDNCFFSDDEDGGVYMVPDILMSITKGNLYIDFLHGRYGYWSYNFRYQDSDLELIGYDASENRGPRVEVVTSINYLTKKMLTKENINELDDDDPIFKEKWSTFVLEHRFKLSQISDFTEFGDGVRNR